VVDGFFMGQLDNIKDNLTTSSISAILILRKNNKIFAIPFGHGWRLLNPSSYEENFGLKIVLNSIDQNQIRQITKRNISVIPKNNQEQLSLASNFYDFSFDIEQDLVQEIIGKSNEEFFDCLIMGKDCIKFNKNIDLIELAKLLDKFLKKYNSNNYKKTDFKFIDHIQHVRNENTIYNLDSQVINKIITNNFDKLWMAIPDLVDFHNKSFSYSQRKNNNLEDINLNEFLKIKQHKNIDLNLFKNQYIYCFDNNNESLNKWSAYKCLSCELELDGSVYLLNNGKWYEIEKDFVKDVNDKYEKEIQNQSDIILLDAKSEEREEDYNVRLSKSLNAENLDRKNITIYGYSKVELCDILTKDKQLIHVKKYGNSSLLGHLFNQGLVSAELLLNNNKFLEEANKKIENENFKILETNIKDYKIIFAIISRYDENLDIPFFSKIIMKNIFMRLRNMGFTVNIKQINTSQIAKPNYEN
jgi:uncharacterized protein (TIGR04141 family)